MSLKSIAQERILIDMIRRTTVLQSYVIMLVDKVTLKVLSSCCKVYDVLEEGVTVVEDITTSRHQMREIDALYFLEPTEASIEALLRDFPDSANRKYNDAYIFFSCPLGNEMMRKIAQFPGIIPHIKCLYDFNMSFIALEERIFHFDMPDTAIRIFTPGEAADSELLLVSEKLMTFFCSINGAPDIRYYQNALEITKKLAMLMHKKIKNSTSLPKPKGDVTLLILDRTFDMATILNHEYTYQALAYDVMEINSHSSTNLSFGSPKESSLKDLTDYFEYDVSGLEGNKEKKGGVLNDDDLLWARLRHLHIQAVSQEVREEIQRFSRENATARITQDKAITTEETMQAIQSMPDYQQLLSKFWMHVSLSEACFKQLSEQQIMKLGEIEQDLSCGIDKDGKDLVMKKIAGSLVKLLGNNTLQPNIKLRLVMLFFTQFTSISDEDKTKVISAAGFSLEEQTILGYFFKTNFFQSGSDSPINSGKPVHKVQLDPIRKRRLKKIAQTATFELSRFDPAMKDVMLQCISGSLQRWQFPFVEEPIRPLSQYDNFPKVSSQVQNLSGESSLEGIEWDWNSPSPTSNTRSGKIAADSSNANGRARRLVIFMIGGFSFAEMRSVYEVSRETDVQVYLGGLVPSTGYSFIKQLKVRAASTTGVDNLTP